MPTIPLTEYQTKPLAPDVLPEEAARLLWETYSAQVDVEAPSFKNDDRWQLTPQGWVGYIPLTPDVRFYLQPRVALDNLFRMLEYAYHLKSFRFLEGLIESESLAAFYERLAHVLAKRVLDRARQGFHRAYLLRQEQLAVVRGQLDVRRTLHRPWDPRPVCRYEEHTPDLADNQILAWTLRRVAQTGLCTERVQPAVRRAYRSLRGLVTETPFDAQACVDRFYTRLNEDYRPMHALCRFFLEHSGPDHRDGERDMLPFLVNMARLYELFVAEWLRAHLPAGWSLQVQERVTVGENAELRFNIDLVLADASGRRVVLDTKYKAPAGVAPADFNQIVTYAKLKDAREAILIYPQPLARPLDVPVRDVRVRTLTFALDGDLEARGQAFLDALGR